MFHGFCFIKSLDTLRIKKGFIITESKRLIHNNEIVIILRALLSLLQPFVDVCLKHKKQSEALKYMPKVKEELKEKYIGKLG